MFPHAYSKVELAACAVTADRCCYFSTGWLRLRPLSVLCCGDGPFGARRHLPSWRHLVVPSSPGCFLMLQRWMCISAMLGVGVVDSTWTGLDCNSTHCSLWSAGRGGCGDVWVGPELWVRDFWLGAGGTESRIVGWFRGGTRCVVLV